MNFARKKQQYVEEAVKKSIYDAAVKVLTEKGLEGLTIQNVASEAEIATGTVYNYFKGKEELLVYIYEGLSEMFFTQVDQCVRSCCGSMLECLRSVVHMVFEFAYRNAKIFVLLHQAQIVSDLGQPDHIEAVRAKRSRMINTLSSIISDGIKEGEFREVNAVKTAEVFDASLAGLIAIHCKLDSIDRVEDPAIVFDFFSTYLSKR